LEGNKKESLANLEEIKAEDLANLAEEHIKALENLEEEKVENLTNLAEEHAKYLENLEGNKSENLANLAKQNTKALVNIEEEHIQSLIDMEEENTNSLLNIDTEHTQALNDMEEQKAKAMSDLEDEHLQKEAAIQVEHLTTLKMLEEERNMKKLSIADQKKQLLGNINDYKWGEIFKWKDATGLASGGFISQGAGGVDDVPALLSKGEFVQKASAVKKYGIGIMQKINSGLIPTSAFQNIRGFNTGGFVSALKNMSGIAKFSEGGEVSSATVNHSIDFNLGNKSFGPFQGSPVTINSFISELSKAKGRA